MKEEMETNFSRYKDAKKNFLNLMEDEKVNFTHKQGRVKLFLK